jgi:hypothetical protein
MGVAPLGRLHPLDPPLTERLSLLTKAFEPTDLLDPPPYPLADGEPFA